jgi:lipoic acid synthetase
MKRRPSWLKKTIDFDKSRATMKRLNAIGVHTVCQQAKCPNISECFKNSHATFLILGVHCTRHCAFCHVGKTRPGRLDPEEPQKVARAALELRLKHVVITSVTRDDLKLSKSMTIELLIPDFQGRKQSIKKIVASEPDIIGHNLETVPRLYSLRPEAGYKRSLKVLETIKTLNPHIFTKSALMLGLGETKSEVMETMKNLRGVGCDFLCLGQYLRPSLKHAPVKEYISPDRFHAYKTHALSLGFKHVESAPYARSSYRAGAYRGDVH